MVNLSTKDGCVAAPSTSRPPRYLRQREKGRSDRAFCIIDGKRHSLGRYGSDESRQRYAELIASTPAKTPTKANDDSQVSGDLTVAELIVAYLAHAERYYRLADGSLSAEYPVVCAAMKFLRRHASEKPAKDFGPKALKSVRQAMIQAGWSRKSINKQVARCTRAFKWAAGEELIPPSVYQSLTAVEGLRKGRSDARETEPIKPVPDDVLNATLEHLRGTVADMVEIARLTGMRPSELCLMRPSDIDRSGTVWVFSPKLHKTAHHGKVRNIAIGPKAQSFLAKYLFGTRCFEYRADSFRRAIHRACDRAGVPRWSPNRLRHNAATAARQLAGIDAAQVLLGHSNCRISEVYAELDLSKAAQVALAIG